VGQSDWLPMMIPTGGVVIFAVLLCDNIGGKLVLDPCDLVF